MAAEVAAMPKLAWAAAVSGADSTAAIAAPATEPLPAEAQQQQQRAQSAKPAEKEPAESTPPTTATDGSSVSEEAKEKEPSAVGADENEGTPAETAARLKNQKQQRGARRGGGARGRAGGGRGKGGKDGGNRKGSWKKLDVDISFKNKQEQLSKDDSDQQSDNANKDQVGRKGADHTKDRPEGNRPNEGRNPEQHAKKQSGQGKHTHNSGDGKANGRQRGNGGSKQQQNYGDAPHGAGGESRGGHQHVKRDRPSRPNHRHQNNNKNHGHRNNRGHNNRHHQQTQYYRQPRLPDLPQEEQDALKSDAVRQVDYFFSVNELSRNVWLRTHMDVEGYVPAAIIFNFPSVCAYGLPYQVLLAAVAETSKIVEVDGQNETIRLTEGYELWLCPNAEGGHGCPRWLKEQQPVVSGGRGEQGGKRVSREQEQEESVDITSKVAAEEEGDKAEEVVVKTVNASNDESSNGSAETPDTTPCSDSDSEHTDGDQSQ